MHSSSLTLFHVVRLFDCRIFDWHSETGSLFTKRTELLQDLTKPRIHEIPVQTFPIVLKFGNHLGNRCLLSSREIQSLKYPISQLLGSTRFGGNTSYLTHWGRVTHICVSKQTIIGSDNGLSPGRRLAIIWTNAGILLIGPLGTKFNEMLIEIHTFSFKEMHLKMSSGKWRPFHLGRNVLMRNGDTPTRVVSPCAAI